jgi:predicted HTH transcriptional regulator
VSFSTALLSFLMRRDPAFITICEPTVRRGALTCALARPTARPTPRWIAELGRRTGVETFDEQPIPELNSEAIDFGAASQCFSDRRALRRSDLTALGLACRHQGRMVPTVGGLLLFGRGRLLKFPDAYIQAGRFAGTDRTDLVDRAELTDYPVTAIEQAIMFVERNTRLGMSIGRVRHPTRRADPRRRVRRPHRTGESRHSLAWSND